MRLRSPIKWFGGKGNFVGKLLPLIPPHSCYVEVFGGSGTLLFAKEMSKVEVLNDLDSDLVNFYRVFHNPEMFKRLQWKCRYTLYSRELYLEFQNTWKTEQDPVERVHKWFFLVRMAFSSFFGKTGVAFAHQRNCAKQLSTAVDNFEEVFDRLRHVQIENESWEIMFDRYDSPNTFFYLDPPYVSSTRKGGGYVHEMTASDHERLIERLKHVQGMVLLSGYANPIYDKLDWNKQDFETFCFSAQWSVVGEASSLSRTESLWRNYTLEHEGQQLAFA